MTIQLIASTGVAVAKKLGPQAVKAVPALATVGYAAIKIAQDEIAKRSEQRQNLVFVPDVIGADILTAKSKIEELGLSCFLVPVEPKIKYKDKLPDTVVKTDYKAGEQVLPGKVSIKIDYISEKIIEESKRLFEQAELEKAEKKATNRDKQTERKERVKNALPLRKKTTSEEEPE